MADKLIKRGINLRVHAFHNFGMDCIDLYIRGNTTNTPRRFVVCEDLVLRDKDKSEEGQRLPPSFSINMEEAQVLMNSLWDCGLRPVQGKGSAGQLTATEKHLDDMRAITAKKLNVELPKE